MSDLDLLVRLDEYADGSASWFEDGRELGDGARQACRTLHTNLVNFVEDALGPLLDRISAREMETFTMHDRTHGNKVAHLMWHILREDRRPRLTPPEIGFLVGSAFLHDVGMALSPDEREARLDPDSDLWERLEVDDEQRVAIEQLRARTRDEAVTETQRRRAELLLAQAQEVLLSQDTRDRHATRERYRQVTETLGRIAQEDPTKIPNVEAVFSFDGDSFLSKLIQICVSHNQDAESLVERDEEDPSLPRFRRDYPVGFCMADLHMAAAALRLADILDFDRERTPPVLFHYLLPGALSMAAENRSVLEWGKHLAISNWHIDDEAVVFRGRSKSHVLHHAVVQFADTIEKEIDATHATFGAMGERIWPLSLPRSVQVKITAEGYRYVPYRFELDDDRVYNLLMGGAIYDNPLVAIRELIQNAVDACKLRDALTRLHEPVEPRRDGRITITYVEPGIDGDYPRLSVADTGTGMDGWLLERFFLKVGRSFYRSSEFNQMRVQFRQNKLDFAPVSEFGIGFLASFLIADQVIVETAMWESIRGDTRKRTLTIDGPTRLIRLNDLPNTGADRFRGTRVSLTLTRGAPGSPASPPNWEDVLQYIQSVCRDLPYTLSVTRKDLRGDSVTVIEPARLVVRVPAGIEESNVLRIPLNSSEVHGEIALFEMPQEKAPTVIKQVGTIIVSVRDSDEDPNIRSFIPDDLLRGGFRVGSVPGLPRTSTFVSAAIASIKLQERTHKLRSTNIARNEVVNETTLRHDIVASWLAYMLTNPELIPPRVVWSLEDPYSEYLYSFPTWAQWPNEPWNAHFHGLHFYRLARVGWSVGTPLRWIERWEERELTGLPFPWMAHWSHQAGGPLLLMLNTLLPAICDIMMTERGYFLSQPRTGWPEELGNIEFQRFSDLRWDTFAEYRGGISQVLGFQTPPRRGHFQRQPGFGNHYLTRLNSRYRDRFADFTPAEVRTLPSIFDRMVDAISVSRPAALSPAEWQLLQQVRDVAGDLLIGRKGTLRTIDSLMSAPTERPEAESES